MNEKNKVENCRIEPKLKLINMDSVEVEQIEWLLYPFIPYGKVTIIQGDPGEGKTTMVLQIIAKLTRGEPIFPVTDTTMKIKEKRSDEVDSGNDGLDGEDNMQEQSSMDENLRWGKPKGNEYRTYFIESPFNFTPVIKNFLSENKKIYCENCMHEFSEEEYNLMKKYGGTCLKCGCKNSIQEKRVLSDEERSEIEEIEKKDNLLEREQYQLLKLLQYSRKDKTATELAQELDVSWQKIGWIAKKIEEDYCYLKKEPRKGKMYYVLSDLGREYLDSITP